MLYDDLPQLLAPDDDEPILGQAQGYEEAGVPHKVARRVAGLASMFAALGSRTRVRLRHEIGLPFPFVIGTPIVRLRLHFDLSRRLRRLREAIEDRR